MSVLDRTADDDTAWKEWRKAGITATDIADAANGTYGGAYAVVARKLDLLEPDAENDQMRRGHRWQPVIADAVNSRPTATQRPFSSSSSSLLFCEAFARSMRREMSSNSATRSAR